ncbi:MAG: PP2C family protein-serine/threonine phosphatase [Phycisphaerales bacterium]|nr:PP2C family protein-serine/threonine phosphatase [Phycisphaerales bacterium]
MYRPTIYIPTTMKTQRITSAQFLCTWAGSTPPKCTSELSDNIDAAIIQAESVEELLTYLPVLLELHARSIPTLLLCDHVGHLGELLKELDLTQARFQTDGATVSGIVFGMLQREDELSILRSKVGLISTLRTTLQEDIDQLTSDLNSAATLQQEFMSNHTEQLHGMYFNTLWRPTGVVSGDMYDITKLDDTYISFFLADAIGHGIPAAMLAMAISKSLAACRLQPDGTFTSPAEVMDTLNQAILDRNGTTARFATAMYGLLNCKTRTLQIAGAGHPSALWIKDGGTFELIESGGPLLGVFPDSTFPQQTISLSQHDRVVCYSDGFEDALESSSPSDVLPSHAQKMFEISQKNTNIVKQVGHILDGQRTHHDDLTMLCLHAAEVPAKVAA